MRTNNFCRDNSPYQARVVKAAGQVLQAVWANKSTHSMLKKDGWNKNHFVPTVTMETLPRRLFEFLNISQSFYIIKILRMHFLNKHCFFFVVSKIYNPNRQPQGGGIASPAHSAYGGGNTIGRRGEMPPGYSTVSSVARKTSVFCMAKYLPF